MKLEFDINIAKCNNIRRINKIYTIKIIYLAMCLFSHSPNRALDGLGQANLPHTVTQSNDQINDESNTNNIIISMTHHFPCLEPVHENENNSMHNTKHGNSMHDNTKQDHSMHWNIMNGHSLYYHEKNKSENSLLLPSAQAENSQQNENLSNSSDKIFTSVSNNTLAHTDKDSKAQRSDSKRSDSKKTDILENNGTLDNLHYDHKLLNPKYKETLSLLNQTNASVNIVAQNLEKYTEEELYELLTHINENIGFESILRATGSDHLSVKKSQIILESFTHTDHHLTLCNKTHELLSQNQSIGKVRMIVKGILKLNNNIDFNNSSNNNGSNNDHISQHNTSLILSVLNSLNKTICEVFIEYIESLYNSHVSDNSEMKNGMESQTKPLLLEKLLEKADDQSLFKITYQEYMNKRNEQRLQAIAEKNNRAKIESKTYCCC